MLRTLFLSIIMIICAATIFGAWLAYRAIPDFDGIYNFPELYQTVLIKFDEKSVPYIEAACDNDCYFAQGYVTAAQRLFQMDLWRRKAEGQLAEVFGPGLLPQDKLMRTVGINRLAGENFKKLPAPMRSGLQAYANGVNAYIEKNAARLSLPFAFLGYKPRPWQASDSLAILKYLEYEADESWQLDDLHQRIQDKLGDKMTDELFLERAAITKNNAPNAVSIQLPDRSASSLEIQSLLAQARSIAACSHPALPIWGSNAWVVGPGLSQSGGALIACDKHCLLTTPDQWYICCLHAPKLHVAGATIPGIPGVIIGRNDNIGWASIDLKADDQDLVLEKFSLQFPDRYKTPHGWQNAETVLEDINVRFAGKPFLHKVWILKDGPVLARSGENGIALAWAAAHEKVPVFISLWQINRAASANEFLNTLANYNGAAKSFVYAAKSGAAGSRIAGVVPLTHCSLGTGGQLQSTNTHGGTIASGFTEEGHFAGRLLNSSQLPVQDATKYGYAVASLPPVVTIASPYRNLRVESVLSSMKQSGAKIDLPDMALLQTDQYAALGPLIVKTIRQAMDRTEVIDRFSLSALKVLENWDSSLSGGASGAAIYEYYLHTLARRLIEPKLGTALTLEYMQKWPRWPLFIENILKEQPKNWLPAEERTYETFTITSFAAALKNLRLAAHVDDPNRWWWRDLHKANFLNDLSENLPALRFIVDPLFTPGQLGLGGDEDAINADNAVVHPEPWSFSCDSGPTARLLIDMHDSDKFYVNLSQGQAEHLLSPHKIDQYKGWLHAEPNAISFSADWSEKQMQHKLMFTNR